MPLYVSADRRAIVAHGDLSRSGTVVPSEPRVLSCAERVEPHADRRSDGSPGLEVRRADLLADGRPFACAATPAEARVWHSVARSLVEAPEHERAGEWRRHLARSLDVEHLAERLAEARAHTRWLGWASNALCVLALVAVPVFGLLRGAEAALGVCWPVLLGIAGCSLFLAVRAHLRLFPDRRGERVAQLLTATFYPPALLRFRAVAIDAFTAGAHPLAWSCLLDPPARAQRVWTQEIAWLEHRARRDPDAAEWLRATCSVIREAWPPALPKLPARASEDPDAESYCPICLEDFRPGFDRCPTCDVQTTRYSAATKS
jgi:hypothetical protein